MICLIKLDREWQRGAAVVLEWWGGMPVPHAGPRSVRCCTMPPACSSPSLSTTPTSMLPCPPPSRSYHRTVWAARHLLSRPSMARLPAALRAGGPSAAGLALIPLVVPHVDAAVEGLLHTHLRPHLPKVGGWVGPFSKGGCWVQMHWRAWVAPQADVLRQQWCVAELPSC